MKKAILKIYAVILPLGAAYYLWGAITGLYLPCYVYQRTGLQCPGCGTSRMFLSLARLDITGAFAQHPVMLVLLIVWNVIAVLCFFGVIKSRRFLYTMLGLSVAALVIFTISRNLS